MTSAELSHRWTGNRVAQVCMDPCQVADVFGPEELSQLADLVRFRGPVVTAGELPGALGLAEVSVLLTGWGGPVLDAELLDRLPKLEIVLSTAGSVRPLVTPAFWARGLPIVSAAAANAVPVAQFTVAQIVLALNHAYRLAAKVRFDREFATHVSPPGVLDATVGLLSLGLIGRLVAEKLADLGVHVLAFDPFVGDDEAAHLGVELVAVEELFARCEVVSVHTPLLPETQGLVDEHLIRSMPHFATLVNTSRGAVVDEEALVRVLQDRGDLWALLDVTAPEPPEALSPLYRLPNVVLTPHIAGSTGRERRRLGRLVVDELRRFHHREPLRHAVTSGESVLRA